MRRRVIPQNGFTLIELLVVISVIALLVSILLPSMRRVKDQAKIAVCKSNLRQIVLGVFAYAHDHSDNMPVSAPHELGGPTGRVAIDDVWLPARMFGGGLQAEQRPLNPYVSEHHGLFRCGADKGEPLWWFDTEAYQASTIAYELYGSSYFYASGYNRMTGVAAPMGLAKLVGLEFTYRGFAVNMLPNGTPLQIAFYPQPSKKVVVGDIPIHRTMPGVIAPNPRAQWHRKDTKRLWANAAFLDGHAELVRVFPYDSPPHQGVNTAPSPWNRYY